MTKERPLWVPVKVGSATRYIRDRGNYSMRRLMEPAAEGEPRRRKWTLFCGDNRVWDVQPAGLLSTAIEEAEAWLAGR